MCDFFDLDKIALNYHNYYKCNLARDWYLINSLTWTHLNVFSICIMHGLNKFTSLGQEKNMPSHESFFLKRGCLYFIQCETLALFLRLEGVTPAHLCWVNFQRKFCGKKGWQYFFGDKNVVKTSIQTLSFGYIFIFVFWFILISTRQKCFKKES